MNWTVERIEQLKTLWERRLSCSQIAKEMGGLTRNAVIGKVHRLNLPKRDRWFSPRKPAEPRPRASRPKPAFNGHIRMSAKRTPIPIVEVVDLPPEVAANPVALFDLQDHHCRWPLGDPHHEMLHCGAQVALGRPYCPAHCRMAYQPLPSRRLRPPYGASNPRTKQEAA